jgi:prepilin-type N-terminal cleavage/methylation domain-containing protein
MCGSWMIIMPKNRFILSGKGFTLLEVLVAMMILSISIVLIIQLFSEGLKAGAFSRHYRDAVFQAHKKIEVIRLFKRMRPIKLEENIDDFYSIATTVVRKDINEKKTTGGIAVIETDPLELFEVTVEVHWYEGIARKAVEMSTLILARYLKSADG